MGSDFKPALPHGPIEQVFPDVFVVRGTARFAPLFSITRNMTILRQGSELTLVSPVRLNEAGEKELEALGQVKHLVKLGHFHGSDDPYYKSRYQPTLWALPGAVHQGDLKTERELVIGGELPISNAELFVFTKSKNGESAILLHRDGGILLTCDSVQNWGDFGGCSAFGKVFMRVMGFGGRGRIGPGWRGYCEPKDGVGFAPDFERLLALSFSHILSAHGYPLLKTAKDDLRSMAKAAYKTLSV